jgi:hypothetical protein
MKVLERCANVRGQILRRNDLRRAHRDAEAFRERAGELQVSRQALADAFARVLVLRAKGVAVLKLPSPTAALTILGECQTKLSENPVESGRDYGRLKRSLDKLGKDLLAVAEKAIDNLRRDLPSVDEAFLKQVESIPTYAASVARIREQRDALLTGSDPGSSVAALEQFLDRRDALRTLADDLKPNDFPDEVLDFFKAGRHGGAPLEKLTATVRQWLADRELLKNVRVTVVAR